MGVISYAPNCVANQYTAKAKTYLGCRLVIVTVYFRWSVYKNGADADAGDLS